jgi:mRNA-degrading endonuclease toxin of MazEF toxin-antitoxin module
MRSFRRRVEAGSSPGCSRHISTRSSGAEWVPLTKNTASLSPSHAIIPAAAAGLKFQSKAVTEQIRAIDKRRLVRRLGRLAPDLLAHVERALKNTLALP